MIPSPGFLQSLGRSQLLVRGARASAGVGERRSAKKGSGMEFADYREYMRGDDVRHLDPRLYARLGEFHIRQYEVHQQLSVTIFIDTSRSMAHGDPDKLEVAKWLAGTFGFAALAGGDAVRVAFAHRGGVRLLPRISGVNSATRLFQRLSEIRAGDDATLGPALDDLGRHVTPRSLVIAISDFWLEDADRVIRTLGALGGELWAAHVVSPSEADPGLAGESMARLVDSETGEEMTLGLDGTTLERYRAAFADWQNRLSSAVGQVDGRYLYVPSNMDLEHAFLPMLRRQGLIRVV